ncbi:MAG: DUF2764 family protein [Chlamydiales bacterium]
MANYYFLITAFPPLTIGATPEMSFKELLSLFDLNLTAQDLEKVKELLRPVDLYNIKALWLGVPLDDRGQLQAKDLEEKLLVMDALPEFLIDYLQTYESTEERLRYFPLLYVSLYRDLDPHLPAFLLQYFRFERELRLVLTGLRAKRSGKDLVRELQFEDPTDPLVADLLAQKDASDYVPPREYEDLKTIFMENSYDPRKIDRAVLEYRFKAIGEMVEPQDFGIDRVLSYAARLLIAETLGEPDKEKGIEQL